MSIGTRIKQRREELGITQTQLAEMIGVTKGAVGNYESGANSPKASIMYQIFSILQCDANYIYQDYMESPGYCAQSENERNLLILYGTLNDEGKKRLFEYADDLVCSKKYLNTPD